MHLLGANVDTLNTAGKSTRVAHLDFSQPVITTVLDGSQG